MYGVVASPRVLVSTAAQMVVVSGPVAVAVSVAVGVGAAGGVTVAVGGTVGVSGTVTVAVGGLVRVGVSVHRRGMNSPSMRHSDWAAAGTAPGDDSGAETAQPTNTTGRARPISFHRNIRHSTPGARNG
jgi:hypothetical protein